MILFLILLINILVLFLNLTHYVVISRRKKAKVNETRFTMSFCYTYLTPQLQPPPPKLTLLNLGKPTRRGIKKCPKCGCYNGTRGNFCKNKHCDAIFRDCAHKRKLNLDAIRLNGTVRQVYSVRVRDRGRDHRGFVQLPLSLSDDSTKNALCFVDSCERLFDDSILKCHEVEVTRNGLLCAHIDAAIKSQSVATPIDFKKQILVELKAPKAVKETLWHLATEKEGYLVQRVSKTVMAVKCQVTPKHPLGYLHFSFGNTNKGMREIYDKYVCSCNEFLEMVSQSSYLRPKCIHYYACVCAMAGDSKFAQEFSHFINYEFPREGLLYPTNEYCLNKLQKKARKVTENKLKVVKRVLKRASTKNVCKKLVPKTIPLKITIMDDEFLENGFSRKLAWDFIDWLTYVTESINQTMRFENYGNLNSLIFYIPEIFYEELKKRIPVIYKNEKLFSNSFHIMNILHLKEIFDTKEVKLRISKRFIHDNQNGYVEYIESEETAMCQSSFIFFLNVGQSTVDESDNTNNSFFIEWNPNITNATKIGQLKLQYKYGRKCT